jgi:hypothetical protein
LSAVVVVVLALVLLLRAVGAHVDLG